MRKRMRKRADKKAFKVTAQRTKKINVLPSISRGGIRL